MHRLGFDYAAVAARNPAHRLLFDQRVRPVGRAQPCIRRDLAVQALSGMLSVNDGRDGTPVVPGVPSADMAAGPTTLSAVLMALIGRERTGRGDYIDVAMLDALLPWSAHVAGGAIAGGEPPRSASQRSLGGAGFYNVYRTADGRYVVLGAREPKFVRTLLTALGRPDLIPLGDLPAGEQGALITFLAETFAGRTRDAWVAWFADKDVAFSPCSISARRSMRRTSPSAGWWWRRAADARSPRRSASPAKIDSLV